ncbi:MAG: type IV pilus modification PilV family protein [Nitrospiraceae bacterium]
MKHRQFGGRASDVGTADVKNHQGGFTLLEVMIAMAILAIALPALLGLRNWDVDLHMRARDMTTATLLAQEKLMESELLGFLPLGEISGDFQGMPLGNQTTNEAKDRAPGYRWKRIVSPTPLDTIREVRIQIIWPRGTIEDTLEASTYVFAALLPTGKK